MEQKERRRYLIKELLSEESEYRRIEIPADEEGQRQLLRSLMNLRMPKGMHARFLEIQDEYLQEEIRSRGITRLSELNPVLTDKEGRKIYLWRGDITALECDAIVNAANGGMTGCYIPCHSCIDNCIHTYAGIQLRLECSQLMEKQGYEEPVGRAKITEGYNLPCRYVLHTVGPTVAGSLTELHRRQLADCYRSCLELASGRGLRSIAFCCISTGVFHFPQEEAAKIAVRTVKEFLAQDGQIREVVFNVFKREDDEIYRRILG